MLIKSKRPTPRDLEVWAARERSDAVYARSSIFMRRVDRARSELRAFLDAGPAYVSVSWGKDSVCVAHLARCLESSIPIYWFSAGRMEQPHCEDVRDAFLAIWPGPYYELEVPAVGDPDSWDVAATSRRITGIRSEESGTRRLSRAVHGVSTVQVCRPIIDWRHEDVFAYLHHFGLPVHPSYACSMDGAIDRGRIRVGPIGGERGSGHGRADWERRYYRDAL